MFKRLKGGDISERKMASFKEIQQRFPELDLELWQKAEQLFPIRITRSWFSRMNSPQDPLGKQVLPDPEELREEGLENPVGEFERLTHPFVIQKHADRALLLVSRKCHMYCRYCFRRSLGTAGSPSWRELESAVDFIKTSGVQEVILSGGDPLFLSDKKLFSLIDSLSESIPTIRVHTRSVIFYPERVGEQFLQELAQRQNIWLILHINHQQEVSKEIVDVIHKLRRTGTPLLNQTVLLKGVNDDVEALEALCNQLVSIGIFPYYLHHTDRVKGASHFFVSLKEGMSIYQELRKRISGVALPRYIIDPEDGSGKIDVEQYVSIHHQGE